MFHKKDIEKDRIYQNTIDYILRAQGDLFQAGSTLTGYVPRQLIEKVFSKIEYNKEKPICIYSDYGEWVDFLIEKYGYDVNFKLVPSSLFGYEMSIRSLERYTENPADFVIFNREKYESMTMIDKYFDDIMKETGMIYQIMTGNPPYGTDIKGGSRFLHYKIMENSLKFCSDKMCLIMPSKPITEQLGDPWYSLFKNAVCVDVEVVDKSAFPGTVQDNTAIYYIDVNADKDDYCKKLDVNNQIYNMFSDSGHILFIDGWDRYFSNDNNKHLKPAFSFDDRKPEAYIAKLKDNKYYLNINIAGIKPGQGIPNWISSEFDKLGIRDSKSEAELFTPDETRKQVIECPNIEYGENLRELFKTSLIFRYSLWLTQIKQSLGSQNFKYIPDIDYTNIHSDEDILSVCGFSKDEITQIMTYLRAFKFNKNRNKCVRGEVKPDSSPSGSETSKPVVDDEDEGFDDFVRDRGKEDEEG